MSAHKMAQALLERVTALLDGFAELRSEIGNYRNAIGTKYSNSLTILSTVISKQGPKCITIDAGLKSLTTDSGLAECKTLGYTYGVLGDEHGSLSWTEGKDLQVSVLSS